MTQLPNAVKAVQAGFWIFPVQDGEKTPHVTTPPYTLRWSECATNDIRRVVDFWTRWPDANIGVACAPSGLLVVDCDRPKHAYQLEGKCCNSHPPSPVWSPLHKVLGPMVDGESVYDAVAWKYGRDYPEQHGTYSVRTGSGGRHFYYRWPDGCRASQSSIVKGILDIRCNGGTRGGYVLGAGSVTTSGRYVALAPPVCAVQPAPAWLVELCKEREPHPVPEYMRPTSGNCAGLQDLVMYAPEGTRNDRLNYAAYKLRCEGNTEEECHAKLDEAAAVAGLTDVETRDTIRSAFR